MLILSNKVLKVGTWKSAKVFLKILRTIVPEDGEGGGQVLEGVRLRAPASNVKQLFRDGIIKTIKIYVINFVKKVKFNAFLCQRASKKIYFVTP